MVLKDTLMIIWLKVSNGDILWESSVYWKYNLNKCNIAISLHWYEYIIY